MIASHEAAFGYECRSSILDTLIDEQYSRVDLRSKDLAEAEPENDQE
jgi:hypothetical protein